jgi:hypothetical protein
LRAANRHIFTWFSYGGRLLLAVLLMLFAIAEVKPPAAADTPRGASHPQRQRLPRGLSWQAATRFARPRFRPTRTINVDTARAFWNAWRGIRPHERIVVHGITFTGEVTLANKELSDWAEVRFDSTTKFVGVSSAEDLPAVWLDNDSHIRFSGGDVSDSASDGMAGTGIVVYDSSYLSWWGFRVHDVGGGGVFLTGIKKPSDHLDFKGDVFDWGHNLSWDSHHLKGTGIQGVNVGDSSYGVNDSRLAFHVHGGSVGSGMEIGGSVPTDGVRRNTIYLWCQKLTMFAANEGAGNCAEVWGENVSRNEFKYIEAEELAGRPYQASGMYSGQSLRSDSVVYGRAARTNVDRVFGKIRWDPHGGTVFKNVLPTH